MKKLIIPLLIFCINTNTHAQLFGKKKDAATDGITGAVHQKYLHKIAFSSNYDPGLNKGSEMEAGFKTEFNAGSGDPIYYRFYMDNSIYNYVKALAGNKSADALLLNTTIGFNFYIDNVLLDKLTHNIVEKGFFRDEQKKQATTMRGALSTPDMNIYLGLPQFKEVIDTYTDKLTAGKHSIKMEIFPVYSDAEGNIKGQVVAAGEFTLNVKNSIIDPNDPKACMPKTELNDAALIKAIAKAHSDGGGFKVDPGAVRILSNKWKIIRNTYSGVIERRSMYVTIGYKDTRNNKCYRIDYTVSQEYIGNNFSDEIGFKSDIGMPKEEIYCKCLGSN